MPHRDLKMGLLKKEGSIESIAVNGDLEYATWMKYPLGSVVTITYHAFKGKVNSKYLIF